MRARIAFFIALGMPVLAQDLQTLVRGMRPGKFAAAHAQGLQMPGFHTRHFEPAPEPTLRARVQVMTATAIALLQN